MKTNYKFMVQLVIHLLNDSQIAHSLIQNYQVRNWMMMYSLMKNHRKLLQKYIQNHHKYVYKQTMLPLWMML